MTVSKFWIIVVLISELERFPSIKSVSRGIYACWFYISVLKLVGSGQKGLIRFVCSLLCLIHKQTIHTNKGQKFTQYLHNIFCIKLELIHRQAIPVKRWIINIIHAGPIDKSPRGGFGLQELNDETINLLIRDLHV